MLSFGRRRIFLCQQSVDMRKAYDSLADLVRVELGMDPFLGDVFVFVGEDRTRTKVLVWEPTGFWLCAKRLEASRFQLPSAPGAAGARPLTTAQVVALLEEVLPRRSAMPGKGGTDPASQVSVSDAPPPPVMLIERIAALEATNRALVQENQALRAQVVALDGQLRRMVRRMVASQCRKRSSWPGAAAHSRLAAAIDRLRAHAESIGAALPDDHALPVARAGSSSPARTAVPGLPPCSPSFSPAGSSTSSPSPASPRSCRPSSLVTSTRST